MIKASEGGGGKGIRKVDGPDDFPALFRQVWFSYMVKDELNLKREQYIYCLGTSWSSGFANIYNEIG